ncbi:hypothetical protein TSUD_274710 [Trifolium subterraneum]|uniref:RRM domain-containing protein n=1 Tax=Trifolium subterraneum TaxID=3900 RepID=A0A2Z6N288_TRISU|nr:hypothetical protein TSUD_274710 [Trifolium subterraneum]
MALCNKIGNLLRQGGSQSSHSSMLNYLRHMSSSKLFIGGLSYGVDDQSLRDAFANYGEVVDARVITDRDTGRSRGFGFVNYTTEDAATSALAMDGQDLNGRSIRVSYATDRPSPGPRPSGGGGRYGGGGNGFSNGGGGW